ncbi:MAG: AMP-binding protein [Deltaproteobacteria bacterium]
MEKLLDVPFLGILFKILKIKEKLGQIKREAAMTEDQLRDYQLLKLRKVMTHAYQSIPLYRDQWKAAGVSPDDLKTLADLDKFPIITKEDLRRADFAAIIAEGRSRTKYHIFKTTGSSGVPVSILYDRDRGFYEIAEISAFSINTHFGLHLKKGMSILVLDEDAMEILPALEFPSFKKYLFDALDGVEKHIEYLNRVRPDYLMTYPSVLKNIALAAQARCMKLHQPKLLFTTGESHDGHTRKIIRQVFAGELLDGYAATETGVMAVECPRHNGLHVLDYKTIIEIADDDGRLLPPGQSGNVIVTDLNNMAFPIIRYSGMGDIAGYKPDRCDCHLKALPLLSRIEGRKIDAVILPGKKVIHPYKLTLLMQNVPGVNKFQIRQEKEDQMTVLIVKDSAKTTGGLSTGDDAHYQLLKSRFQAVLGDDMIVKFEFVDDIPRRENSHKFQTVVSMVRE